MTPPIATSSFWLRAVVQIFYVGCLAFCCPGMFNALNGLGKAGGKNENVGNAANAALYGTFAVFGYFGGACFNLLGNKVLMLAGGATYAFYAAGIYVSSNVEGAGIVAILSGALLGAGAGWFWTAQGAMMMSYATPLRKGYYIGIFWILFNLGGMIGGLLTMALNWNTEIGAANAASYFTFVVLMSLGAIGAVFLCPASKVVREDGETVKFEKAESASQEIRGAFMVLTDRTMLLLTALFLASNFFYPYQFNAVNGTIFNVRTRGFNSALYWGAQMLGSYLIGKLLDFNAKTTRKRGYLGIATVFFVMNLAFILGAFVQYTWDGTNWDKTWDADAKKWTDPFDGRKIDFTETSRAIFPIIVYIFYGLGDAMLQTYAYWHMAAAAGPDTALAARYAGYYKGVQSLGACISWLLDLYIAYIPQFWICWALFLVSVPPILISIKDLPDSMAMHEPASLAGDKSAVEATKASAYPETIAAC